MSRCKKISLNSYAKHSKPPIPDGFRYVGGSWDDKFVIENKSSKSQFFWVPVDCLDADGTINGINFNQKFGRRPPERIGLRETENIFKQIKSINTYKGFYTSCYFISLSDDGNPLSVKKASALTGIYFTQALKLAKRMGNGKNVTSHLTFGCEYDSAKAWFDMRGKTYDFERRFLSEYTQEVYRENTTCIVSRKALCSVKTSERIPCDTKMQPSDIGFGVSLCIE